jgi:hypothetical protein
MLAVHRHQSWYQTFYDYDTPREVPDLDDLDLITIVIGSPLPVIVTSLAQPMVLGGSGHLGILSQHIIINQITESQERAVTSLL